MAENKRKAPREAPQPLGTAPATPGSVDDAMRQGALGTETPPKNTPVYGSSYGSWPTPALTPAQVQAAHVGVPSTPVFAVPQYANTLPGLLDPSARQWAKAPKVPNYQTPNLTSPTVIGAMAEDPATFQEAVALLQSGAEVDYVYTGEMERDEPREHVLQALDQRREELEQAGGGEQALADQIDEAEQELAEMREERAEMDKEMRAAQRRLRDLRDQQRVTGDATAQEKLMTLQSESQSAPEAPEAPERRDPDAPVREPPGGQGNEPPQPEGQQG